MSSREELEDKLLELQVACRDCPDLGVYGDAICADCQTPRDIARLERLIQAMREQESRTARRPARDRRQSKPNMIYARGMAR